MLPSRHTLSRTILRIGLGIVFLWIGVDILRHPDAWIGFIPAALPFHIDRLVALQMSGALDAALGIFFLIGFFIRIVSFLGAVHLLAILVTQGIDQVLIRDVGLLAACLALLFWPRGHFFRRQRGVFSWRFHLPFMGS